jgi:RecA/RadA recombinase
MSLADKLLKNSKIKGTSMIKDSEVFGKKESVVTNVPMINVALSGKVSGGLLPGMLMLAGPSKHFKTAFALIMAAAFQKQYPDGYILFYDSEFGSPETYFQSFGIDMDRVIHSPLENIEEFKFDIANQLKEIVKGDKLLILVDSVGNLASKKEVEDAIDEKAVADMTRAKQLKSLFRIITPHLNLKDIPMVVINHTYKTLEMYAKDVVSGGTGGYYSADAIWIIGRRQDKDTATKEITGYDFIINIEKSRHVREGSKIPISVSFSGGVKKWSGLFDLALALGYIHKPKQGWYNKVNGDTGEITDEKNYRKAELEEDAEYWKYLLTETEFPKKINEAYTLSNEGVKLFDDSVIEYE